MPVKSLQKFVILAVVALSFCPATVVGETNFTRCLADVRNGLHGIGDGVGGTDNQGHPVNTSEAKAVTYKLCLKACGSTQEPFSWVEFSTQFSSWLLPWLALISQLPFGANNKADNLDSVLLTLGSPTLAAYSLGLTVLNGYWIARHFSDYTYPNVRHAIRILSSLQQAPLEVNAEGPFLASLVVLPENDKWWSELEEWINYTHTWSTSAIATIAWVVVAYIFTVIDTFEGDMVRFINSNGLAVGSMLLWLLPVVMGWLQISPKCDSDRISSAIERGNTIAYVATNEGGPILVKHADSEEQALKLTFTQKDALRRDEKCTVPIYNYARLFSWMETVAKVSAAFESASNQCHNHKSVDGSTWVIADHRKKLDNSNRVGNATEVTEYCRPLKSPSRSSLEVAGNATEVTEYFGLLEPRPRSSLEVVSRIFVASVFALMLQWGTIGAAIWIVWATPTQGLGCRSASYLLYAVLSTIVWILLVTSSILTHYYTTMTHGYDKDNLRVKPEWPTTATKHLSIIFRCLGKIVAAFNSIWVLFACMFQFSNFYNRCYCNSSIFWLRDNAYYLISIGDGEVSAVTDIWIGCTILAAGSVIVYILFIYVHINPPLPE